MSKGGVMKMAEQPAAITDDLRNYWHDDDVAKLEKANAALTDKLSDYQQGMAVLAGENEALVAAIDEILYDLLESNPIMSVYWRKKTLHLRVKEGGEG